MSTTSLSAGELEHDLARVADVMQLVVYERELSRPCFRFVNDAAQALSGHAVACWAEACFWEDVLLHPGDRARVLLERGAAVEAAHDHVAHYRVCTADGRVLHVRDHARVTPGPDGRAARIHGVIAAEREPRSTEPPPDGAIDARERQLRRAQVLAGLGTWEWDLAADRATFSDELCAILGLAPGVLDARFERYRRAVYPADRGVLDAAIARAIAEGRGFELDHRVVRPDGELRSVRAIADVELDVEGTVIALRGLVQDVTGRLEAERRKEELFRAHFAKGEARTAERRVREVLEAIPQQVWVTDARGDVRMVNARVSAYFEVPVLRLERASLCALVHPDDLERAVAAWREAQAQRATLSVEIRLRRACDGAYRWHLCRAEPQLGREQRVEGWIGTNTDVHALREAEADRERAEREAEVERGRLRTIVERAPAAIGVTRGRDHVLVGANDAFRVLASGAEVIGRSLAEILTGAGDPELGALLDRVLASGRPHVAREVPLRVGDAPHSMQVVVESVVISPLLDANGAIEGLLFHAVDVSDMVRARVAVEEKAAELGALTRHLEAANEELDRFAYVTSHDLRAPLRGISNLAQWIDEDLRDRATDETREHLALLRGRVRRLEMLIDGILKYSRAGRGSGPVETVDVRALLEGVLDLLDPPPDARIEICEPLPVLVTERVPLAQVLQNLVDNALTHGRAADGANIRVSASRAEDAFAFTVADGGPGIDPRFHDRIFAIFQTLGTSDGGTGIGLPLVRKIVESRGGEVWLDSRAGEGAAFHFTWPDQQAHARGTGTMPRVPRSTPRK